MKAKKEYRAGCILVNCDNDLLIVRNISSGYWGFPKGGKKDYETYLQAAIRELKEETGQVLTEKNIHASFSVKKSQLFLAKIDFAPECNVDKREINAYMWVPLSKLKQLKISKFTLSFIKRIDNYMRINNIRKLYK